MLAGGIKGADSIMDAGTCASGESGGGSDSPAGVNGAGAPLPGAGSSTGVASCPPAGAPPPGAGSMRTWSAMTAAKGLTAT